jgi:cell division protein FtsQ
MSGLRSLRRAAWGPAASVPDVIIDAHPPRVHAVRHAGAEYDPARRRFAARALGIASVLALLAVGLGAERAMRPDAFPIREIRVAGEFRHLQPQAIRQLVIAAIDGGFFAVDVNSLRRRILEEPWVKQASVRRLWPSGLQVVIAEQDPVARWGTEQLLNSNGAAFTPSEPETGTRLPRLSGPSGSEQDVLARYRDYSRRLAGLGLALADVHQSERRAWTLVTGDGVRIVLGRKSPDVRLERFVRAYQAVLAGDWQQIGAVDMRYTNGLAVARRADAARATAAASHNEDGGDAQEIR